MYYKTMHHKTKSEKIEKLKGILCRDIDGGVFLRVYGADGSFRDYRIAHFDLEIEITDEDAYAYWKQGEWVIDYGPKTLGMSNANED
jgi:hypothetical protein